MTRYPAIILTLLTASLVLVFYGCVSGPSLAEIKKSPVEFEKITVEFEKITLTPPPRTFDATVTTLIDHYKTVAPSRLACARPHQILTRNEIARMASDATNDYFVIDAAMEEFLNGNYALSLQMAQAAAGASRDNQQAAICHSLWAFFLAESGDFKSSEQTLGSADRYYSDRPGDDMMAHNAKVFSINFARASIANAKGDADTARSYYFRALVPAQTVSLRSMGRWREGIVQIGLARAFIWSGHLLAAENWIREAIALLYTHSVGGTMTREYRLLSHGLIAYSDILFEQGRFDDAEKTARCAMNMLTEQCVPTDSLVRARARQTLAIALLAQGRWQEALEQFEAIQRDMATDPDAFDRNFGTSRDWGSALLKAGRADEALSLLDKARIRARQRYGLDHYVVAEIEGLIGLANLEKGWWQDAMVLFEHAVPVLLRKWRDKDGESMNQSGRNPRLVMIVDAYLELLVGSGSTENALKSLAVAGGLQSQTVARSLASSAARFSVSDAVLMDLIRKRQDLELKMAAVQNRLTRVIQAPDQLQNADVRKQLFEETETLRSAIKSLDVTIMDRFPDYDAIVNPGVMETAQVRAMLHANEALIYVFTGQAKSYIWALPKNGSIRVHTAELGVNQIAGMVSRLRDGLDPGGIRTLGDIPTFDLQTAYELYAQLLEPVEDGWKHATSLLVVTPGALGQIPLSILPTASANLGPDRGALFSNYKNVPWLSRNYSVTVLPSIATLAAVRSLPPARKNRKTFAGFGDPLFSEGQDVAIQATVSRPSVTQGELRQRSIRIVQNISLDNPDLVHVGLEMLAPLPDTAEEVRSIARTLAADPDRDVFLGAYASEHRVKNMHLADRRILVFATHGLVPGDLDGLTQPALAMSFPRLTENPDDDGLLTMGEIMGLKLDADLVVLSACNTAAGNGRGTEAISGLGQSFFYAGVRTLLVTAWPVETTSAKSLTTALFKRLVSYPDLHRAEVLRQTVSAIMDAPARNGFCYAHPIFWAPYMLVGDSR